MEKENWTFADEQRDAVCKGEMCPACLSSNTKKVGFTPDGINMNYAYDCLDCEEEWEGY